MRRARGYILGLVILAGAGAAQAEITASPIPKPRPFVLLRQAPADTPAPAQVAAEVAAQVASQGAPQVSSPKPEARPRGLLRAFTGRAKSQPPKAIVQGRAGSVCGVPGITGQAVPPIPGRISGCGVENPVRITAVSGVRLSQPATMDCTTAKALATWVDRGVKPAIGRKGGGLAALNVAAGYSCRTRNSQPGAKISEHGRGRAIDISGFTLANGDTMTVLKGWGSGKNGRDLKQIHKAACGPFGTVLGPNSDSFHKDHFHLDTARYRSGSYCR